MSASLLQCRGLAKEYRVGEARVAALNGVDLDLGRGEILAVVGESGSGKTTLGNLVLGIEAPDVGEVRLEGETLPRSRSRALRRRIQLVPQNPLSALNPKLTILESVALPLAVHGLAPRSGRRARVADLLAAVGLSDAYMDRHPRVLSGGQRQRVALARALAAEPDVIVLDEPTSALDVSVQARILALLAQLQRKRDLSYLFITHDLGVVRALAHRVVVLYRGRVVEVGPTSAVFAAPLHRYTQMLLASVPVISDAEARSRPDWPNSADAQADDAAATETGCAFRARCPFALEACAPADPEMVEHAPGHGARCINPHARRLSAEVAL